MVVSRMRIVRLLGIVSGNQSWTKVVELMLLGRVKGVGQMRRILLTCGLSLLPIFFLVRASRCEAAPVSRLAAAVEAKEEAFRNNAANENRDALSAALWARAIECLTPDNVNIERVQFGGFEGIRVAQADLEQAIRFATRAAGLQRESLKIIAGGPANGRRFLERTGGKQGTLLIQCFTARLNAVENINPDLTPAIKAYRDRAMEYVLAFYEGLAAAVQEHPEELFDYDNEMFMALYAVRNIPMTFVDFVAARDRLVLSWIQRFDQHWPHVSPLWQQAGHMQTHVMRELLEDNTPELRRLEGFSADEFNKSMTPIAKALSGSSCAAFRLYGCILEQRADPKLEARTAEERDGQLATFLRKVDDAMADPNPDARRALQYAYIAAVDAIEMLPRGDKTVPGLARELCGLALRRGQLIPSVALGQILQIASSDGWADEWLDPISKALAFCESPDCMVLDGNAGQSRRALADALHSMYEAHPEFGPQKSIRPWDAVTRLASIDALPQITRLEEHPRLFGQNICFLGSGMDKDDQFFIQGFEVPLTGGALKPLARLKVNPLLPLEGGIGPYDGYLYRLIQGGAIDDDNYYVSVRGQGVAIFPRDGSPASQINASNGLSTNWARSLVASHGALYIACSSEQGAFLCRWNGIDRGVEICTSSIRKESKTPLDDLAHIRFVFLYDDAARNRLMIGIEENEPGSRPWHLSRGGLWQWNIANGEMKHLLSCVPTLGLLRGVEGETLCVATTLWVVKYDLARDAARYASVTPGMVEGEFIHEMDSHQAELSGTGWAEPHTELPGTRGVIDGRLWMGDTFSRLSADGQMIEKLDAQLMPDAKPIGPVWTMLPAPGHRLVLGDIRQLYAVQLFDPEVKSTDLFGEDQHNSAFPAAMMASARIPSAASLSRARRVLKEVYADELIDRAPSARRRLAGRFMGVAAKLSDDAGERFVLLNASRDASLDAKDLVGALKASELMVQAYELDPLQLKLDAAMRLNGKSDGSIDSGNHCRAGLELFDQLLAAKNISGAKRVAASIQPDAAGDPVFNPILARRLKELDAPAASQPGKLIDSEKHEPIAFFDLLPKADPIAGAVHGLWSRTADGLLCDASLSRFEFPYRPPAEYIIRVEFTRLSGNDGMDISIGNPNGAVCWTVGGWNNTQCAFHSITSVANEANPSVAKIPDCLHNGQRAVSCLEVRDGEINGYLNGKLVSHYKSDLHDTAYPHMSDVPPRDLLRLAIGGWQSQFVFHRVEVLEISGQSRNLRQ